MKSKKAMAMETIIMFIIALIVLFVVLWIFRDQIGKTLTGYNNASTKAQETASGDLCRTILEDKACYAIDATTGGCPEGTKLAQGTWKDCTPPKICCEQG